MQGDNELNHSDPLEELRAVTTEMVDAANARKGKQFGSAASAVFESMQAAEMLGTIRAETERAGLNVSSLLDAVQTLMSTAAARAMFDMSDADQGEVIGTAKAMFDRRRDVQRRARAATGGR